jgi:hypothetical protein
MIEIIEVLNGTSAARTVFYVLSATVIIHVVMSGLVAIVKYLFNK